MHAGNFYSHAGYKRAMVMRATKTTMWTQCVNSKAWSGIIIEYSNVMDSYKEYNACDNVHV